MRVIKKLAASAALVAALAAFGAAPSSATTLQTANNGGVGNNVWSGVGLEFTVGSTAISVSGLGIFDNGENGITGPLTADLLTTVGGLVATATFTNANGPVVNGGYQFQTISPVTLNVGQSYWLVGYGWATDLEHNSNVGGNPDTFNGAGLVSYVQSGYTSFSGSAPGTVPDIYGAPNWFSSANMQFSAVGATPLPSTWLMLLSGFVGLGYFAYRGTKKRTALAVA